MTVGYLFVITVQHIVVMPVVIFHVLQRPVMPVVITVLHFVVMPDLIGHLLVLETEGHHNAPDDAGCTEDYERILPAELVSDISRKPSCEDHSHIV